MLVMPKVGKKKFPYTKKGKAAAKKARASVKRKTTKSKARKRY
tara:strand:- start:431 stop:559 length:129 start_codon:yes stop_codon:yes gene_type:complete